MPTIVQDKNAHCRHIDNDDLLKNNVTDGSSSAVVRTKAAITDEHNMITSAGGTMQSLRSTGVGGRGGGGGGWGGGRGQGGLADASTDPLLIQAARHSHT